MKRSPLRTLHLECLESRDMMTVNMSPYEQLLLELVNRARANPTAEAARYGIDLNQGLSAGTISSTPKQPLAPNQILIDTAGAHTQDMLDNNYISHNNLQGQTPSARALAAGYPVGVGENISWGGTTGPLNQIQHVFERHQNLFLSSGHRKNILKDAYEEIGIGVRFGPYTYNGINYNSSMATEMFGTPNINPVITGVVFTDASNGSANDDNFYSIGEQVTSGTITATNLTTNAVYTTGIGSSGGYALQVTAGTYKVVASFGSQSYQVSSVVVGSLNVKVDFETTTATPAGNLPPSLQPIADVQFALTQSTFNKTLIATDADSAQLTFSVTFQNLAYHLDQTLGLTQNTSVQSNWGGLGEKWLKDANGASYYITPFGDLFAYDGVSGPGNLSGNLIATLLPQYYTNLSSLYSAQPGLSGVVATVNGSNLSLSMNSSVSGTFVVTATVNDGVSNDTESFYVTRGFRVTHHDPQDFGTPVGTLLKVQGLSGQAWQPDNRSAVHPSARPGWIVNLRGDRSDIFRPFARPTFPISPRPSWLNDGVNRDDPLQEISSASTEHQLQATSSLTLSNFSSSIAEKQSTGNVATLQGQPTSTKALQILDDAFASWQ